MVLLLFIHIWSIHLKRLSLSSTRLFIFFGNVYRCLHLLFRAWRNRGGGVADEDDDFVVGDVGSVLSLCCVL